MAATLSIDSDAVRILGRARRRFVARSMRWIATGVYAVGVFAAQWVEVVGWVAFAVLVVGVVAWIRELSSGFDLASEGPAIEGRLDLDGDGIDLTLGDARERIARSDVVCGWIEEGDFVVFGLSDRRSISAHVPDEAEREALLDALGVGAAHRVLAVPVYSGAGAVGGGELTGVIAAIVALPFWIASCTTFFAVLAGLCQRGFSGLGAAFLAGSALASLVSTVLVWLALAFLRHRRVVVGTDGIVIEGVSRKVVPFGAIERVTLDPKGVLIRLKNGGRMQLPTGRADPMYPTPQTREQALRAQRLVERVEQALAESGKSEALAQKATWLERSGRSVADWTRHLEALGQSAGDYRRPGITLEELSDIARDGLRTPEQRAAAMFLLGRRSGESARESIAASADPDLRRRLTAALDGQLE